MCNGRCWRRHSEDFTREKSDVHLRAPNSDDMDFLQKFFCLSSRVGNQLAAGNVSPKNINSKWSKKYRQSESFRDDSRSPRVKGESKYTHVNK